MAVAASEVKTVRTDSMEIEYFTFGEGEKIFVMLPGAALISVMASKDAIAAAYAQFADEYTVYVFDYRKNIPDGFKVEDMADDVVLAMDMLGLKNTYMFGCSLGGMVAQTVAGRRPELVKKMILASTMAYETKESRHTCEEWSRLCKEKDVVSLNRSFAELVYSEEFYAMYEDIFKSMENIGTDEEMDWLYAQVQAFKNFDGLENLKNITCPVFVIGSWNDKVLSYEGSIELAAALHADFFLYSGYGHAVYDEAPDYKDRIARFFAD